MLFARRRAYLEYLRRKQEEERRKREEEERRKQSSILYRLFGDFDIERFREELLRQYQIRAQQELLKRLFGVKSKEELVETLVAKTFGDESRAQEQRDEKNEGASGNPLADIAMAALNGRGKLTRKDMLDLIEKFIDSLPD